METKTKVLPRMVETDSCELVDTPKRGPAVGGNSVISPYARAVISITPVRAGTSELLLDCGHVVRRRLALCPPRRVICPSCRGSQ